MKNYRIERKALRSLYYLDVLLLHLKERERETHQRESWGRGEVGGGGEEQYWQPSSSVPVIMCMPTVFYNSMESHQESSQILDYDNCFPIYLTLFICGVQPSWITIWIIFFLSVHMYIVKSNKKKPGAPSWHACYMFSVYTQPQEELPPFPLSLLSLYSPSRKITEFLFVSTCTATPHITPWNARGPCTPSMRGCQWSSYPKRKSPLLVNQLEMAMTIVKLEASVLVVIHVQVSLLVPSSDDVRLEVTWW